MHLFITALIFMFINLIKCHPIFYLWTLTLPCKFLAPKHQQILKLDPTLRQILPAISIAICRNSGTKCHRGISLTAANAGRLDQAAGKIKPTQQTGKQIILSV